MIYSCNNLRSLRMNEIQMLKLNKFVECILLLLCISPVLCSHIGLEMWCEVVVFRSFYARPEITH